MPLSWMTDNVISLTLAAIEDRDVCPILADALEEASVELDDPGLSAFLRGNDYAERCLALSSLTYWLHESGVDIPIWKWPPTPTKVVT